MSVQSQRGRKVAPTRRNPLRMFYIGIGAVLLLGAAFLITVAVRGGFGGNGGVSSVNAPVGRTAEGFYYKGNPEASVKVIGYEDYQCPACAYYEQQLSAIIDRDYIETGKVQFIYHEFPLDVHPHAVISAEAARCAGDQNKFWEMHDMIFMNQNQWANLDSPGNTFGTYAGQLGLNRSTFDSCLSTGTHRADVTTSGQAAVAANVQATPTFSVNGKFVTTSDLATAIDAALRAGK